MNRNTGSYITFLNSNDRSSFHRSQPATRSDPFRPKDSQPAAISDIVGQTTSDSTNSGLDVYDPAFEADLNAIADQSLSGSEEDY